jgi:hypothetical protein
MAGLIDWQPVPQKLGQAMGSPPNGEGGSPRQGWLNAYDGVFYRLVLGIFGYSNYRNQASYSGTVTLYTPLNQRFEFRSDIPVANANPSAAGGGFTFPYSGNTALSGSRSTFNANLAVGYDFTPHDYAPIIGDLVWHLATNYTQAIDNRAPSSTPTVSLAPGFRTRLG